MLGDDWAADPTLKRARGGDGSSVAGGFVCSGSSGTDAALKAGLKDRIAVLSSTSGICAARESLLASEIPALCKEVAALAEAHVAAPPPAPATLTTCIRDACEGGMASMDGVSRTCRVQILRG